MSDIAQILHNNGFKYHRRPTHVTYVVENLEIVQFEPMVKRIDVMDDDFIIYIIFKFSVPAETNFGLDFDVDGYYWSTSRTYITKTFSNENEFINELHRMNFTGSNIKG